LTTAAEEETENLCPACAQPGTGGYCSHCSERMVPERITIKSVLKSIPDVFFDVEHGLFYSIKMLFKAPGETLRRYFKGDRQRHYKPLKFVLFIGGLYAFLFISFNIHGNAPGVYEGLLKDTAYGRVTGQQIDLFTAQWTSVIMLIQFPVIAFVSWLVFRKRKYFYGEHFVANAYFIGEVSIFQLLMFPLYYGLNGTRWIGVINNFYLLWIIAYYTYAFYDWLYFRKTTRGLLISITLVVCLIIMISALTFILSPLLYYIKLALWGS